jgi:D-arabinose 1-dehydrogenase-like Zn-dependent alcohol dehydrogenase
MKAVLADAFGGAWRVGERPLPEPGPNDLLVQIEGSGICYSDVHQLTNERYGGSFPRIPGHEAVGRVVACGDAVAGIGAGERVGVAYAQRWCGRCDYCAGGWYEHCASADFTGFTVDGGHAEFALMDADSVERVPDGLDPVEAAPVLCAGFTVYSGLCDVDLRPGERCAVVGIGGLGHLAVQYAAALGAEVVAVTSSARKKELLEGLGAAQVVVAHPAEIGSALKRVGGVDVIVQTANGVEGDLLSGLRPFGRMTLLGVSSDAMHVTPIDMVFGKLTIFGSCQGPRHRLREVLELHSRVGARTIVERYGLDEAPTAYAKVASGEARFRAVLVPTADG